MTFHDKKTPQKPTWYFKSWFLWLFVLIAIVGIYKGVNMAKKQIKRASGFTVEKITMRDEPVYGVKDHLEEQQVVEILDQPFFYLGKGKQFFVFESADKKYVLKFFQQQRFDVKDCYGMMPEFLSSFVHSMQKKKKQLRKQKMFKSVELAYNEVREETGLEYVHLKKSTYLDKELCTLDKRGAVVFVPLDETQFILQKKAEFIKPMFMRLMHEGREEDAKERLSKIFHLVTKLTKKGLYDEDGALIRNNNIGFIGDEIVYIDVGRLIEIPEREKLQHFLDVLRHLRPLHNWFKKHYPSLAVHFEDCRKEAFGELS